jgi:hypothetical protein
MTLLTTSPTSPHLPIERMNGIAFTSTGCRVDHKVPARNLAFGFQFGRASMTCRPEVVDRTLLNRNPPCSRRLRYSSWVRSLPPAITSMTMSIIVASDGTFGGPITRSITKFRCLHRGLRDSMRRLGAPLPSPCTRGERCAARAARRSRSRPLDGVTTRAHRQRRSGSVHTSSASG